MAELPDDMEPLPCKEEWDDLAQAADELHELRPKVDELELTWLMLKVLKDNACEGDALLSPECGQATEAAQQALKEYEEARDELDNAVHEADHAAKEFLKCAMGHKEVENINVWF